MPSSRSASAIPLSNCGLTVVLAAQISGAPGVTGVRADSGGSVVNQAVLVRALEA